MASKEEYLHDLLQEELYEAERDAIIDVKVPWSMILSAILSITSDAPDDLTIAEFRAKLMELNR